MSVFRLCQITMRARTHLSSSAFDTERFGAQLSRVLAPGDVLLLSGPLGSGKTTLMKGLARGLGIRSPILSPTFVLRKRYVIPKGKARALNHIDAYRLSSARELRGLLDEAFQENLADIWCIEWGKKLRGHLPGHRLLVMTIDILNEKRRRFRLSLS